MLHDEFLEIICLKTAMHVSFDVLAYKCSQTCRHFNTMIKKTDTIWRRDFNGIVPYNFFYQLEVRYLVASKPDLNVKWFSPFALPSRIHSHFNGDDSS